MTRSRQIEWIRGKIHSLSCSFSTKEAKKTATMRMTLRDFMYVRHKKEYLFVAISTVVTHKNKDEKKNWQKKFHSLEFSISQKVTQMCVYMVMAWNMKRNRKLGGERVSFALSSSSLYFEILKRSWKCILHSSCLHVFFFISHLASSQLFIQEFSLFWRRRHSYERGEIFSSLFLFHSQNIESFFPHWKWHHFLSKIFHSLYLQNNLNLDSIQEIFNNIFLELGVKKKRRRKILDKRRWRKMKFSLCVVCTKASKDCEYKDMGREVIFELSMTNFNVPFSFKCSMSSTETLRKKYKFVKK